MFTVNRDAPRRGVILLIVLSLLAMFGLVGIGFIVITSHNRRAAKTLQKVDQQKFSPREDANRAILQVVRGTAHNDSVIGPHGLLEDLYGNDSVGGTVPNVLSFPWVSDVAADPGFPYWLAMRPQPLAGGQILEFTVRDPNPQRFVGRAITFLDGPLIGVTTRVVGLRQAPAFDQSSPADGIPDPVTWADGPDLYGRPCDPQYPGRPVWKMQVMLPDEYAVGAGSVDFLGNSFIVNGAPFSGTGFGLPDLADGDAINPAALLNAGYDVVPPVLPSPLPYALLPNSTVENYHGNGSISANEEYDAVDYQNMLLAMVRANNQVPTPSLHRPALINYWFHKMVQDTANVFVPWTDNLTPVYVNRWRAVLDPGTAPNATIRDKIIRLKRGFMLGPLPEDHQDFDASNPARAVIPIITVDGTGTWIGQPSYWEADGPWDVDNDGDGVPDSIWVDLGLPVRQTPDGRKYKPLFAILCVDQDGRLNLNAHGCSEQLRNEYTGNVLNPTTPIDAGNARFYATGGLPFLPRGQGYGPAEINLLALFTPIEYRRLLLGDSIRNGRYGETQWGVDGTLGFHHLPAPGRSASPWPSPFNDPLSYNLLYGFATNYFNPTVNPNGFLPTEYGTPADLKGTMTIGLDLRGQPIYDVTQSVGAAPGYVNGWNAFAWANAGTNDPYEMDVSKSVAGGGLNLPASEDSPFTLAEFERVWRPYDADTASLPDRLVKLAPLMEPQPAAEDLRHKTTPASWDLPCPAAATPVQLLEDFRDQLNTDVTIGALQYFPSPATTAQIKANDVYSWAFSLLPPRSPHDILAARLYVELRNASVAPLDARAAIERSLPILMPTDLLAGLKMNVNRPFGNGVDDDGNGIVDEPTERFTLAAAGLIEPFTFLTNDTGGTASVAFDHDNDGIAGTVEQLPGPQFDPYCAYRQAYARHLYVLMMALTNDGWYPPEMNPAPVIGSQEQIEGRARGIAQWAVNVVDFRDRDAVMTPFEYDIYPFVNSTDPLYTDLDPTNTWDVDGIIDPTPPPFPVPLPISPDDAATHRGLVWGCERPELLISETLAFHDRRTEDTTLDPTGEDIAAGDDDFDQRYRPQGSLFIELFNPQPATDARPGEFYYDRAATTWRGGVVLNQGTPANDHPVWRMAIVEPATPGDDQIADPDDPATGVTIERSLYFVDPSVMAITGDGQQFYTADPIDPILNNRYAVIGPGDPDRPGTASITKIGFRNPGPPAANQGRRIVLDPTAPNQVEIYGEDNGTDDLARPDPPPGILPRTANSIQPTVAVIIDQPRRLSVSELIGGYSPAVYDQDSAGYVLPAVIDMPEDMGPAPEYWTGFLDTDDTHAKFRVLHLQRLADPLRDYDSQTNPYRTVDSAQIDLTAFNGVTAAARSSYVSGPPVPLEYRLFTRERGDTTPPSANNLWQVTISADRPTDDHGEGAGSRYVRSVANPHFFDEDFSHTLGYVNEHFGDPRRPNDVPNAPGYMGDPTDWAGNNPRPFPWLTWNNRPFVSHLELAMVPAASSSRLLVNYSMATGANNPYEDGVGTFGHLLNFFNSDETLAVPPDPPPAHFYRLLEFVHVPSRFVGTQDQINPVGAMGPGNGPHGHHPPFHWVSRYREPGRMNLNTVFNLQVYTGLMNSQPGLSALATEFEDGRRGYGPVGGGLWLLNPACPTRFANPFRSFCGLERVPMAVLSTEIGNLGGAGTGSGQGVNATLLRAAPPSLPPPRDPLWTYDSGFSAADDSDRNPYFRYQGMQRLGNLTTTRSNVFAVWITVGHFEVERRELKAGETEINRKVYLEGYTLGRELGGDTGEVKRHRAFYVIDRSIPVGFQRGRDLNAEKAIVLKRFIE